MESLVKATVPIILFLVVGHAKALNGKSEHPAISSNETKLPTYLGIIEDDRDPHALREQTKGHRPEMQKRGLTRILKLGFVSHEHKWSSYQGKESPRHWIVAFDGKQIGEVESEPKVETELSSSKGVSRINSPNIPERGMASSDFSGWSGDSRRRPLVALSQPNFQDPEHWRRFKLTKSQRKLIWHSFPKPTQPDWCTASNGGSVPVPLKEAFPESSLFITKAYLSDSGAVIAGASLKWPYKCDPDPDSPMNRWFKISGQNVVEFGTGLEPVDAGDYDHDGQSEFLFFHTSYSQDGYVLFFDNFRKSATMTWQVH